MKPIRHAGRFAPGSASPQEAVRPRDEPVRHHRIFVALRHAKVVEQGRCYGQSDLPVKGDFVQQAAEVVHRLRGPDFRVACDACEGIDAASEPIGPGHVTSRTPTGSSDLRASGSDRSSPDRSSPDRSTLGLGSAACIQNPQQTPAQPRDTSPWDCRQIIASPTPRSHGLAQAISSHLGVPLFVDARLQELNFGAWEGRLWSEIEATEPEAFHAWMQDWRIAAPPEGESFPMLRERIESFLHQERHALAGSLVVTHAGVVRAMQVCLKVATLDEAFAQPIPHLTPIPLSATRPVPRPKRR